MEFYSPGPKAALSKVVSDLAAIVRLLIVLLLIGLAIAPPAKAQYTSSENVFVNRDSVTVSLSLSLVENLTRLPTVNAVLGSSNSSQLAESMTRSIQKLEPGASVTTLRVSARTMLLNANLSLWLLKENYDFTVQGANTDTGSSVKTDLTFLSMNDSDPVKLNGTEINNVGTTYLLQPLNNLPTTQKSRFFVNNRIFLNKVFPDEATSRFNMLDLSWIPSFDRWTPLSGPLDKSTVWTVSPPPPYNMTIGLNSITEASEIFYFPIYLAVVDPTLMLTVSEGNAVVDGRTLTFQLPVVAEIIMPILVLVLIATSIASLILDRRLTKTRRIKKKR